jgi:hypothetical protein
LEKLHQQQLHNKMPKIAWDYRLSARLPTELAVAFGGSGGGGCGSGLSDNE